MNRPSQSIGYRLLAILAVSLCLLLLVEGAAPQFQMLLFAGHVLIGNSLIKVALLTTVVLGSVLHPRFELAGLPLSTWMVCIGFLMLEIPYLIFACGINLDIVLFGYNGYYLLLLIGPGMLAFRDAVSERTIIRCIVLAFLVCASIGLAQFVTGQPILPTQSADGGFVVGSYDFLGDTRAFSLFTSSMNFGIFCALVGALGVALSRKVRVLGTLLFLAAAFGCYITLTRLCYLVFVFACFSALILTFGKRPTRGRWLPVLYLAMGISTILGGLRTLGSDSDSNLQNSASLLDRVYQWAYYYDFFLRSTVTHQLLGAGLVQNEKIVPPLPMVIDNLPLALILHIGIVGLVLIGILTIKMWLYLRREAMATQQPLIIAAASLWSTLACAGIFNIVFSSFGIVFAIVILCKREHVRKRRIAGSPSFGVKAT